MLVTAGPSVVYSRLFIYLGMLMTPKLVQPQKFTSYYHQELLTHLKPVAMNVRKLVGKGNPMVILTPVNHNYKSIVGTME